MTPMGTPADFSTARIAVNLAWWSACTPWLKFSRNISAPAAYSLAIISRSLLAGPSVAMILVERFLRMRGRLYRINQNCAEVVNIGQGRAADQQIIQPLKQCIGVIVGQQGAGIQAGRRGTG